MQFKFYSTFICILVRIIEITSAQYWISIFNYRVCIAVLNLSTMPEYICLRSRNIKGFVTLTLLRRSGEKGTQLLQWHGTQNDTTRAFKGCVEQTFTWAQACAAATSALDVNSNIVRNGNNTIGINNDLFASCQDLFHDGTMGLKEQSTLSLAGLHKHIHSRTEASTTRVGIQLGNRNLQIRIHSSHERIWIERLLFFMFHY